VRPSLPHHPHRACGLAAGGRTAPAERLRVRPRRVRGGGGHHHADAGRDRAPVAARPPPAGRGHGTPHPPRHLARRREGDLMEIVIALAVGVMFGSGIWLILRPRTFQLITGLLLMSYAVNLFIFAMGRLWVDMPPITPT